MFKFNKESRERLVKSVIDELKAEVIDQQSTFDVTYTKDDLMMGGFVFRVKIAISADQKIDSNAKELFYEIKNYLTDMFNYMFRDDIDVCICSDDKNLELDFEIASSF